MRFALRSGSGTPCACEPSIKGLRTLGCWPPPLPSHYATRSKLRVLILSASASSTAHARPAFFAGGAGTFAPTHAPSAGTPSTNPRSNTRPTRARTTKTASPSPSGAAATSFTWTAFSAGSRRARSARSAIKNGSSQKSNASRGTDPWALSGVEEEGRAGRIKAFFFKHCANTLLCALASA